MLLLNRPLSLPEKFGTTAPMTSSMNCSRNDVVLLPIPFTEWQAAGLNDPCCMKAQIATVEESLVVKAVGRLTVADRQALDTRLRIWLRL